MMRPAPKEGGVKSTRRGDVGKTPEPKRDDVLKGWTMFPGFVPRSSHKAEVARLARELTDHRRQRMATSEAGWPPKPIAR